MQRLACSFIECERLSLRMPLSLMWMVHTLNVNSKSYWIRMLLLHPYNVQHTLWMANCFRWNLGKPSITNALCFANNTIYELSRGFRKCKGGNGLPSIKAGLHPLGIWSSEQVRDSQSPSFLHFCLILNTPTYACWNVHRHSNTKGNDQGSSHCK